MDTWVIIGLVIIILIILILRSRSVSTISFPSDVHYDERRSPRMESLPEGWSGTYKGVVYKVESYSETITIEIELEEGLSRPLKVDARSGTPKVKDSSRREEIIALLNLGADYIDIGFHANRVAAEIPLDQIKIDRNVVTRVVDLLIRLRDKSR